MQIIYEKNGEFYDMSTASGRREILGEVKGKTILVHNEQGELISFYDNPEQMERNSQLLKTVREKYPNVPLRKAIDFFEQELLLKSQQEKNELMLKSRPTASKPVTKSRPGWEKIDRTLAKLDEMIARNAG